MRTTPLINSFRARLLVLLAALFAVTLGVQYYVNWRSVRSNATLIVEQEQAIMAGVALGINSFSSSVYMDQLRNNAKQPLLGEQTGRVTNVLVVDSEGDVRDSFLREYAPRQSDEGGTTYRKVRDVPLPPLSSAVKLIDENQTLPPGLSQSAPAAPGEPGAFYFPVETDKGRWYVIVVLGSANTLRNILERQTSRSALYTLLLLFTTTLITGFFVWRFTRPIKDLSVAARRVAGGDFSVRVSSDRRDEMGALATAFNEMAVKLGRTRELEWQLHQAEKGAVVGRLAAAIAHEIRNPLNYINLTLDHLRSSFTQSDADKQEKFRRLTDQLKTEVARINRHITDFLNYSRPYKLDRQTTDVRAELEDSLRLISVQAAENDIEMRLEEQGRIPLVSADREVLRSAFTNLLINGLQAIDGQGGSIVIKLFAADAENICLEFSDTGRGIAAEDISKVFEPYYSTKETGTGLGLAIVKKAVDDHGGTIRVSSKLGSGTTFTITLPTKGKDEDND